MVLAARPLVDREDLLGALQRATAAKVTIIAAAAGSGKTSLLRAWVAGPGREHRIAAVQVQRDQQDAQQFWLAVLAAVRRARGPEHSAEVPAATPGFDGRAMVDRVLSELADQGDASFLVIDDLHELTSPAALSQLARLLANLPPHVHAVLATRHDLPLGLHQLRLAGELAEIRSADLRFSMHEARELLDGSGVTLSDAGLARLHQRTEGWAAGLRLAAISLAGHPDPELFVTEFSGSSRTVAEYLMAEMLERQPAEVQQLLVCTSLLDRVNGELGDLLTGQSGSDRLLLGLEDANAFVVSLDPGRTWFRYHHLFADLLRLELRRTIPGQVPALHRRAAAWFIQHGQVVDAIRHTQAAGDWAGAARLLADHSFSLTLDGQTQTIAALLRAFPPGVEVDGPDLALARATSDLAGGDLDDAAAHLAVAQTSVDEAPPDRRRRLDVTIASLNLGLARRRGNLPAVIEHAQFLASPVTATAESDQEVALDNDLRAVALMNLGVVEAWSLANDTSERHLREGADLARKIGRPYLEVGCLAQLAFASKIRPFATTKRLSLDAISLAEHHGWGAEPIITPALVSLAGVMALTGRFDEGEQWLGRARQALQSDTGPGIGILLRLAAGMLSAGRGRHQEALAEFSAAEHLQLQLAGSHALADQLVGWKIAAQARAGQLPEARASLAGLDGDRSRSGDALNARAVICLAEGNPAGALDQLRGVIDGTVPVTGYVTVAQALVLAAQAHHELGDRLAATRATERALALAESDRLVLPFAMAGSAAVLEALPSHETAHAALLADILDVLHGSSPPAADASAPAEQLSPTELRVLRYLPTNLSRPEIASQLSVSVNTVNTHIRNIYAKLQAQDRSSAVQRARELRLLSGGVAR